jgi:hypothetical protein
VGNNIELPIELKSIVVFYSKDVFVFDDSSCWDTDLQTKCFVPNKDNGFVIVCDHNVPLQTTPLYAFALCRPAGLWLHYGHDVELELRPIPRQECARWINRFPEVFKAVVGSRQETRL